MTDKRRFTVDSYGAFAHAIYCGFGVRDTQTDTVVAYTDSDVWADAIAKALDYALTNLGQPTDDDCLVAAVAAELIENKGAEGKAIADELTRLKARIAVLEASASGSNPTVDEKGC